MNLGNDRLVSMDGNAQFQAVAWLALAIGCGVAQAAEIPGAAQFRKEVQPILTEFCYDCHGDGMQKGEVTLDEFKSDKELLENRELWWRVLKNLNAGVMPPPKKPRPGDEQKELVAKWIKTAVFEADPKNPDPGRVTVRRLNRVEYRNTIRDLMKVDFNSEQAFPPDDSGHGFDNIGDVLTLPPMLLEKYLAAAKSIVEQAVPTVPKVAAEKTIAGRGFRRDDASAAEESGKGALPLSYYEPASVTSGLRVEHAGRYQLVLDFTANERYVDGVSDLNKCRLVFKVDGQELLQKEYVREGGRAFRYEFDQDWQPGEHKLTFELQPLTPDEKKVRSLELRVNSVTVRGPMDEKHWVRAKNHERFFTKPDAPQKPAERASYARALLGSFATKAFRRPVDDQTIHRLGLLAESVYSQPGKTFEAGVAHAMTAVLVSPRFLFREEGVESVGAGRTYPFVDEYALASRLSYFLWSSMPDDELFRLAGERNLRANLSEQVKRMLADSRSAAFIQNFTGQWLQARDIESVVIEARAVLNREEKPDPEMDRGRARFRELRNKSGETLTPEEKEELAKLRERFFRTFRRGPRAELTGDLRRDMRRETEMVFEHTLRNDRSLLELIDSDYTFLNERLAKHYGITNVAGDNLRLVKLPPDSPRGGVLSQGTVLAVTSNPTRTSPVKRGLFILDNILGMPPPPPPPNIPALEDAAKEFAGREPTLRETLALHREKPLCSSCHNRMDPLGLALENFNAMGMWRETERDQPIDPAGKLITGESFTNLQELKRILVSNHRGDFYHCLTEKLLTYALGRGLEYYDVQTVDQIVERIEKEDGRFSALLMGVIESAPFQKNRNLDAPEKSKPAKPSEQRADARTKP